MTNLEFSDHEPTEKTLISQVEPMGGGFGYSLTSELIDQMIEEPVRPACHILYDKNIQTFDSGANLKFNTAYIAIVWDTLSEENREIARVLGFEPELTGASRDVTVETFLIEKPIDDSMTISEVADFFNSIAEKFQPQAPDWLPHHTIDEMEGVFGYSRNDPTDEAELVELCDQTTGFYYEEPEHLQKVQAWREQDKR
ncbi:MAG: hypothetical protein Q7S80_02315 [bacterium]|nr:hypothetical protein [bacterium]